MRRSGILFVSVFGGIRALNGGNMVLKNKNIILVPLRSEHLERSRQWVNDRSLWPLILRSGHVSKTDQRKWYRNIQKDPQKLVFAICHGPERRHVGNTGFYERNDIHRRAKFWIFLGDKDFWGQGVGSIAARMMLDYGFRCLNFEKIYLEVSVQNVRAIRLYRKYGFRREGILRKHYRIRGKWFDAYVMSLFRKKFKAH